MSISWSPHEPLNGAAVFLSASVPHPQRDRRFLTGPLEELLMLRVMDQRIFDAVQSLVAQLLGAGGRLVHGGHPTITNAISALVSNWFVADDAAAASMQPPVLLYQSNHFANLPPPPGREEMAKAGLAVVRWTPTSLAATKVGGELLLERFPLQPEWIDEWLPLQAPATAPLALKEALLAMRLAMFLESQPIAAVCIGGMEGIEAEARLYRDLCERELLPGTGEVNVLKSTFGAAAQLANEQVRVVDGRIPEHGYSSKMNFLNRVPDPLRMLNRRDLGVHGQELAQDPWLERISYDAVLHELVRGIGPTTSTPNGPDPTGSQGAEN